MKRVILLVVLTVGGLMAASSQAAKAQCGCGPYYPRYSYTPGYTYAPAYSYGYPGYGYPGYGYAPYGYSYYRPGVSVMVGPGYRGYGYGYRGYYGGWGGHRRW